jgi:hypothetical protein
MSASSSQIAEVWPFCTSNRVFWGELVRVLARWRNLVEAHDFKNWASSISWHRFEDSESMFEMICSVEVELIS